MSGWASELGGAPLAPVLSDVALAFGVWRIPNPARPVLVMVSMSVTATSLAVASVRIDADRDGGTVPDDTRELSAPADTGGPSKGELTIWVPPGGSYRIVNVANPAAANAILEINEVAQ